VLTEDVPDDLTDTHHRAGHHRGANRLVLGEYAVRMCDHHDAAPGHGAGEPHAASSGGEDLLAYVGSQIDASVSRRVWRRRRLERPDDPKRGDRRPVNAGGGARTRQDGGPHRTSRPGCQGARHRRPR
jgi:hypothetical protein